MHLIPFKILTIENSGFHVLVDVEIINKKYKMVIDTGASKTVLDKQTLLENGFSEKDFITSNILSTGLGTNDMKSYTLSLEKLKINTWEIIKYEVAILDLSAINYAYSQMNFEPVIGVLGGDLLLTYGAIIDYKNKTLKLNSRKRKARL